MCCFSGPVVTVADTQIFARMEPGGRQVLVYGMSYAAAAELAMVLPLPVPPGSSDDAVRFVSLQAYPEFFVDLHELFQPGPASEFLSGGGNPEPPPRLPVHDVGAFEASFVPSPADFVRLDERFRLSAALWDRLPEYRDYGFAVFKLKPAVTPAAAHPMALSFPTRRPDAVFFPSVHVHDGEVHGAAVFDHSLYLQFSQAARGFSTSVDQENRMLFWQFTERESGVDIERAAGLVDPAQQILRLRLEGRCENRDIWVGDDGYVPAYVPPKSAMLEEFQEDVAKAGPEKFAAWLERLRVQLASARESGEAWFVRNRTTARGCATEADVDAALAEISGPLSIYSTAQSADEQGAGLTRAHWRAGDR